MVAVPILDDMEHVVDIEDDFQDSHDSEWVDIDSDYSVAVDDVDYRSLDIALLESNFLAENTVMIVEDMGRVCMIHAAACVAVVPDSDQDIHLVALAAYFVDHRRAFVAVLLPFAAAVVDLLSWECSC